MELVRTYTCEGCAAAFTGDTDDALDTGWETPQLGVSHCTCPNCTLTDTAWFKIVVAKKPASAEEVARLALFEKDAAEAVARITAPVRHTLQTQTRAQLEHSNQVLYNTHNPTECVGQTCTLHSRSNHPMRSWPQTWQRDEAFMERICPHGNTHPDPDEYVLYTTANTIVRTHAGNCDGCCIWASGEDEHPTDTHHLTE